MNTRFSKRANADMKRIDAWWQSHRPDAPQLFDSELKTATDRLRFAPYSGTRYQDSRDGVVYRTVLETTRHHLYYLIEGDTVHFLAIWGSPKGRLPRFRR